MPVVGWPTGGCAQWAADCALGVDVPSALEDAMSTAAQEPCSVVWGREPPASRPWPVLDVWCRR